MECSPIFMNATDLSKAIRSKKISCREVMEAFLAQIDLMNPAVNAIVCLQERDVLLAQADERDAQLMRGEYCGVMHGFPLAVKDLAATKGIVTSQGSPLLADFVPNADAIVVERMKASGAIIIGKTNTPEFGLGSNTYNNVYGITANAYDNTKTAGGSSGGAAVSIALKMQPVADGSDMMGSLRNPAAYNNVYGMRPSIGLVPMGPAPEVFLQQFATEGPMGRTVEDVALLLSVQAGYDARAPLSLRVDGSVFAQGLSSNVAGMKVGWLGDLNGYLATEPGVLELCGRALRNMEAAGFIVEDAKLGFAPEKIWDAWITMRGFLVCGMLGALYRDTKKRTQMKPEAIWEVENGLDLTAAKVYAASLERSAWYRQICRLFEKYDVLALPSAQVFPFDKEITWPREINGRNMDTYHRWMETVVPATMAGAPAISVPAGFNTMGLPMGLQLIGKPGGDLELLKVAQAYEKQITDNR